MKEKKYEKMKENVRNVSEKQENMRLKREFKNKKKTRLQIIYVTGDFNSLKNVLTFNENQVKNFST